MDYRSLGQTGLRISEIGLGSMQFRWTTDEATSYRVLDTFYEAGGTFIDTADIYSRWADGLQGGEAETIIGRWMKRRGNRQQVVLATKVRGRMWDGPDGEGLGQRHLLRAVEDSLARLQTDYVDLYQTHWPDEHTPIEDTLATLDTLVRQGKVRHLGCSNHAGWELVEAILLARQAGLGGYVSVQPHWSLVHREEFERHVYPVVRKYGLGIVPYSPLGHGFLTGKYRRGEPPPASQRLGRVKPLMTDRHFDLLETLETLGRARGKTPAQMALGWLLAKPHVAAPIVGANTPAQLADSLGAAGLRLEAGELEALDRLTAWESA